jgi:hypothetical protein
MRCRFYSFSLRTSNTRHDKTRQDNTKMTRQGQDRTGQDRTRRQNVNVVDFLVLPIELRFPDMKTEWLALWVHFLWSGAFTMLCCFLMWRKIGLLQQLVANDPRTTAETRAKTRGSEAAQRRRRLLNIALFVTACLILNVATTLRTSVKLEEWSRTSDISLACEIQETWNSRSWDVYGFDAENIVEVCSAQDSVTILFPCVGACYWHPGISNHSLVCSEERPTLEDLAKGLNPCDCPCDHLIKIQKPRLLVSALFVVKFLFTPSWSSFVLVFIQLPPSSSSSVVILTLAHVAQALVVVVVGLNMGFRYARSGTSRKSFHRY